MTILHRYITSLLLKNFAVGLITFVFLFLMVDFFDRIDNVLTENSSVWLVVQYFACKIPRILTLMLPVAMIFGTLFTFGLLSKSSELTAMRASGVTVFWLARPLVVLGVTLTGVSLFLNEVIVPYSERYQKEIYNIKIRQKDKKGTYNQSDFWWRNQNRFYAIDLFNSRSKSMHDLSEFVISDDWEATRRTDAKRVEWLAKGLGWTMKDVNSYYLSREKIESERLRSLPLPISENPEDFYEFNDEPATMSYRELENFIERQKHNGVATSQYLPDLYNKLAFPFVICVTGLLVLPFALLPARSGSMAVSSLLAIFTAFTYFAVDSFSISMGRAELLPPLLAAWSANIVMGIVAFVLNIGTEAPR